MLWFDHSDEKTRRQREELIDQTNQVTKKRMNFLSLSLLACPVVAVLPSNAAPALPGAILQSIYVTNPAMFFKAARNARPGDEIVVKAGEYELKSTLTIRAQGLERAPII